TEMAWSSDNESLEEWIQELLRYHHGYMSGTNSTVRVIPQSRERQFNSTVSSTSSLKRPLKLVRLLQITVTAMGRAATMMRYMQIVTVIRSLYFRLLLLMTASQQVPQVESRVHFLLVARIECSITFSAGTKKTTTTQIRLVAGT
uniref:Uncharacterized protein n=1 Tax=Echinococcus canadensis TaxID=519352 RepID=A0A915EX18_9CEST